MSWPGSSVVWKREKERHLCGIQPGECTPCEWASNHPSYPLLGKMDLSSLWLHHFETSQTSHLAPSAPWENYSTSVPFEQVFFTVMESSLPVGSWRMHCLVNRSLPLITYPIPTISISSICFTNSKDCMWTAAIISLHNYFFICIIIYIYIYIFF